MSSRSCDLQPRYILLLLVAEARLVVLEAAGSVEPRPRNLWLVTRQDWRSSVEAADPGPGLCRRQPEVDSEAVLQLEARAPEGRVADRAGAGLGVAGAGDLYQAGTFSFSMLAWIRRWYGFRPRRLLSGTCSGGA